MRGSVVIVRAFGGQRLVRRVWDVKGQTVYVCDERGFERLLSGDPDAMPVGFPAVDVFEHEGAENGEDSDNLQPWKGA